MRIAKDINSLTEEEIADVVDSMEGQTFRLKWVNNTSGSLHDEICSEHYMRDRLIQHFDGSKQTAEIFEAHKIIKGENSYGLVRLNEQELQQMLYAPV